MAVNFKVPTSRHDHLMSQTLPGRFLIYYSIQPTPRRARSRCLSPFQPRYAQHLTGKSLRYFRPPS